jgi:hypothetical protein
VPEALPLLAEAGGTLDDLIDRMQAEQLPKNLMFGQNHNCILTSDDTPRPQPRFSLLESIAVFAFPHHAGPNNGPSNMALSSSWPCRKRRF